MEIRADELRPTNINQVVELVADNGDRVMGALQAVRTNIFNERILTIGGVNYNKQHDDQITVIRGAVLQHLVRREREDEEDTAVTDTVHIGAVKSMAGALAR